MPTGVSTWPHQHAGTHVSAWEQIHAYGRHMDHICKACVHLLMWTVCTRNREGYAYLCMHRGSQGTLGIYIQVQGHWCVGSEHLTVCDQGKSGVHRL